MEGFLWLALFVVLLVTGNNIVAFAWMVVPNNKSNSNNNKMSLNAASFVNQQQHHQLPSVGVIAASTKSMLTAATATTSKRRRRLPRHKQQTLQLIQQLKQQQEGEISTAATTQEALALLQLLPVKDDDNADEEVENDFADTQIFVDALHICSKARRSDVALAIYPHLCHTEACRQMAIYACGKCILINHHENDQQQQIVLDLLRLQPSPLTTTTASIASYNTALTVLDWRRAYHLLLHDMTKLLPLLSQQQQHGSSAFTTTAKTVTTAPACDDSNNDEDDNPSVLSVLSCNIVLNSMAKAHRGDDALELWNYMTGKAPFVVPHQDHQHPLSPPNIPIFPRPDRSSWHHVMTACLTSCQYQRQQHYQLQQRTTTTTNEPQPWNQQEEHQEEKQQQQQQQESQAQRQNKAREIVYSQLFLPHVAATTTATTPLQNSHDAYSTNSGGDAIAGGHDGCCFVPNHRTYDLLARGFAKLADWEMVRRVEEHRRQQQQQQEVLEQQPSPTTPMTLSSLSQQPQNEHLGSHGERRSPSPSLGVACNRVKAIQDEDKGASFDSSGDDIYNNHSLNGSVTLHQQPTSVATTTTTATTTSVSRNTSPVVDAIANDETNVLESQYYYFQHWTGMTKVGRGKGAYYILGTYHEHGDDKEDEQQNEGLKWRIALQPHRNPSKNGIKLLFLLPSSDTNQKEHEQQQSDGHGISSKETELSSCRNKMNNNWNRVGYVLMINARATQGATTTTTTTTSSVPTSTLLGLFIDPTYRKQGLSKTFLAIWLYCCRLAKLQPQTGLIRKPLLALVLEHTFGFVPTCSNSSSTSSHRNDGDDDDNDGSAMMTTTMAQGVEVEIFFPPPDISDTATDTSGDSNTSSSGHQLNDSGFSDDKMVHKTSNVINALSSNLTLEKPQSSTVSTPAASSIHLYSPYGKSLKGTFSPWDLLREGIVIDCRPPPEGSRGRRIIHLMCTFVLSSIPDDNGDGDSLDKRLKRILGITTTTSGGDTHTCSNNLKLLLTPHELQNVFLGK